MTSGQENIEAIKREYADAVAWTHGGHYDYFIPSAEGICLFRGLDAMENAQQVREAIELGLEDCRRRMGEST